jgi:hypothetical protein
MGRSGHCLAEFPDCGFINGFLSLSVFKTLRSISFKSVKKQAQNKAQ